MEEQEFQSSHLYYILGSYSIINNLYGYARFHTLLRWLIVEMEMESQKKIPLQ